MDRRAIASDALAPRGRRPRARNQVSRAGTGISRPPATEIGAGVRAVNLTSTTAMYGDGKSDRPIVPEKPPNKTRDASRVAEGVEERGLTKGNSFERNRLRTPSRTKGASMADSKRARSGKPPIRPRVETYSRTDDDL